MRRGSPRTETIDCDPAPMRSYVDPQETAFEKQRGVSHVEIRDGFGQVHLVELAKPLPTSRIAILKALAENGISIDFLKLTPTGLSFLVAEEQNVALEQTLSRLEVQYSLQTGRAILMVFAVNMRDEEGLIAEVVQIAIASGAKIDHVGDGHDRLLLVVERRDAGRLRSHIERSLIVPTKRESKGALSA